MLYSSYLPQVAVSYPFVFFGLLVALLYLVTLVDLRVHLNSVRILNRSGKKGQLLCYGNW